APGPPPPRRRQHREGRGVLPPAGVKEPAPGQRRKRKGGAMDEAKWLACTDPWEMLEFLRGRASARKLRLFACACVGRFRDWLADGRSRAALETARRYADGLATGDELRRDREAARLAWPAAAGATGSWSVAARHGREFAVSQAAHAAFWAAGDASSPTLDDAEVARQAVALAWGVRAAEAPAEVAERLRREERRCQCELLRCVAGN